MSDYLLHDLKLKQPQPQSLPTSEMRDACQVTVSVTRLPVHRPDAPASLPVVRLHSLRGQEGAPASASSKDPVLVMESLK